MIPIFCANCGAPWGMVPEKHITFAFALCDKCFETHGAPAHLHMEPDRVFWERVAQAAAEEMLSPADLTRLEATPIAKLLDERRALLRSEDR